MPEPASPAVAAAVPSPILGPSALGTDLRRLWVLAWTLAVTDFKLKFFGSVLGYLWQLMRPLLLFSVLYVVFSQVLDVTGGLPDYPVSLLLGIVLFQFFTEATAASVRAVVYRENLIRKVEFPRMAIPLSTVLTSVFNLGLNLVPVLVFLFIAGGTPRLTWLEVPFILALLVALAFGLAMLLSALFIRFRDVEPIWDVTLQALFYATPILYSIQVVIDKAGITAARIMMLSPLAAVIQQARHALVSPAYLSSGQIFSTALWFLVPVAITAVTIAVGWVVFSRAAGRMAEDL